MNALHWLREADAVIQACAVVLLAMSVASWVVILYKLRLMAQARSDVARAAEQLWAAPALEPALQRIRALDRHALVWPLVAAAAGLHDAGGSGALAQQAPLAQRATRALRGALHAALARLRWGQVLLATVGATAPFVGLLGTVWGIQHALTQLAGGGQISIERLAGPVGEALIMTAAGLAAAIPAVLAYNGFGRSAGEVEAELEGLAHDLHALVLDAPAPGR
ncbi:MotA/TolQ/ExbB proton channel family protein [Comamonas sp. NLF-1-9]|uniref:MotA/TolQ/ExbB proton channel family protein n=1 Tax=Comamonas sp. NLF-1-9 TaxID=2853163 RepID=UPI001C44F208|nr:MotA/TolQ/ExbB proton channel family protein [Comamonas sp. NLF-1-9]QXL84074.1 MotA/TolQ/ExbB proton channel family protein [Comamonas sp. NLF-1-9]